MKTVRLLFALLMVFFLAIAPAEANRNRWHAKRNSVYTPHWVSHHAVRTQARHIFLPDFNVYYDRANGLFIYSGRKGWRATREIPRRLRGVNLRRAYQVSLSTWSDTPERYNRRHQALYSKRNDRCEPNGRNTRNSNRRDGRWN